MNSETERQLDKLYGNFIDTISEHRLTFDYPENDLGECKHCQLSSTGIAEHLAEKLFKDVEETIRKAQEAAWDEGFDAGEQDVHQHKTFNEPCIPNPYRRRA